MTELAYLAVDLETTGLVATEGSILEVAWTPLTKDFKKLDETKNLVLEVTPAARAQLMENEVVRQMHVENGLIKDCLASTLSREVVEKVIEQDIARWPWADGRLRVFGSSVHFDLGFLKAHMPSLSKWLHYRVFDVTTLIAFAEAKDAWVDERTAVAHRAKADIDWSIYAAQKIRNNLCKSNNMDGGVW